ncbi:helix-turn-helix domain-containing protein [Intrasporangium sp.]|uniref:helix-turn-helix domain-containing protein n=1 Tax=Intrasporangium sp. TaxID=1925024 RepID=UPI0039C88D23
MDWADDGVLGRFVVRARRRADLSQRELAEVLGVSPATVSRVESGHTRGSLGLLAAVLRCAGLRLAVVDSDGCEVEPVAADVVRDNADRRFPAHLDVAPPDLVPPARRHFPRYDRPPARGWYHLRPERDRLRIRSTGTTSPGDDHPTVRELEQRRQLLRARPAWVQTAPRPLPECRCFDRCYLGAACPPTCPCQCEPAPRARTG